MRLVLTARDMPYPNITLQVISIFAFTSTSSWVAFSCIAQSRITFIQLNRHVASR
jgi:hypothetical protein